jgi:hypothetical protein
MPTVVLHQWEISPFCGKVRKVLNHKAISFTAVNYNGLLARRAKGLSRAGKLPVLEFDGERVQDSSDIVVFLERHVPQPAVIPADPAQRALAWLLEDWADESLYWCEAALRLMDAGAWSKAIEVLCSSRPAWERIPVSMVIKRMYRRKLRTQGLGKIASFNNSRATCCAPRMPRCVARRWSLACWQFKVYCGYRGGGPTGRNRQDERHGNQHSRDATHCRMARAVRVTGITHSGHLLRRQVATFLPRSNKHARCNRAGYPSARASRSGNANRSPELMGCRKSMMW